MSGKPYTMREMKVIVEYLNTHKAYGEIKGRKLWTDFASSNLTNRTWQSLKETFLKRILPDIHNPYYGLTTMEICSFKQGYDVDQRNKSKLDIQTISDDSNHSDAGNVQDNEKPSTSNNVEADKPTGEKTSPSTLAARTRASTETIILENCYESPEDIQRDLESPKSVKTANTGKKEVKESPIKTLRDKITYAEPFTPMMQQVLDDFASEDELVEANLEILESSNNKNKEINNKIDSKEHENLLESNKENDKLMNKLEDRLSEIVECSDSIKIPLGQESKIAENNSTKKSSDLTSGQNGDCNNSKTNDNVSNIPDKTEKGKGFVHLTSETLTTQNSNNLTDTILPGNQEALKDKDQTAESSKTADTTKTVTKNLMLSRKRANSYDAKPNSEKKNKLQLNDKFETTQAEKSPEENKEKENDRKQATDNLQQKEPKKVEQSPKEKSPTNPCLSSVSLYDEQFNNIKYTDSDVSDNEKRPVDAVLNVSKEKENEDKNVNSPKVLKKAANINEVVIKEKENEDKNLNSPKDLKKAANINEVVILKSHSESDDSKEAKKNKEEKVKHVVDKKERDKALASVFGFSSGAVSSGRKRKLSRRHRSPSYINASHSSEWTSESDSEYVSPPRGRRNRHARKYLKPKSARILSLEDEGGLFVMHGKRIYPLVKDGNIIKNYLTFSPESDPEDDPNYWKKKYKEERKKTEELKKFVEEVKVQQSIPLLSPLLPTPSRQLAVPQTPPKLIPIPEQMKVLPPIEIPKQEVKTLKIKFTKNNEELQLEGAWSQIHPALADVVQIFSKESEPAKEVEPPQKTNGRLDADEILSLRSSPIDEEAVRKKVEEMEEEIFKEIEKLDKSEREQEATTTNDQESNVNKRKRVVTARKSSLALKSADSSSSPSRAKRTKAVKQNVENGQQLAVKEDAPKRQSRTPKTTYSEKSTTAEKNKKPKSSRKSAYPEPESTRPSDGDSEVRYMFPPAKTQNARKSAGKTQAPARSLKNLTKTTSENLSQNSIEGYQDSDASPAREIIKLKRKRKLSLSTISHRGKQRRFIRRKSYPCVSDDASSESSNLSPRIQIKHFSDSLKSEVYRSESYQLLMPKKKRSYTTLEKIDELTPTYDHDMDVQDAMKNNVEDFDLKNFSVGSGRVRSDGNSSNITLPQSPELSIVENISVSKELINSIEDFPTINEIQANTEPSSGPHNKYLMSAVDVTMPLMGQDCEIKKSITPIPQKSPAASESLLNRIDSVNITDGPSISDSLDIRLRNLLLESAKKMEVDTLETIRENCDNVATNITENGKKSRAKKRCSTPQKRNNKKKAKIPDIEPVVEEERMEFCSYGGRKSCPPAIQVLTDNIYNDNVNDDLNKIESEPVKRGRKKKDVIKVKILKPTKKSVTPVKDHKKNPDVTTISVHTDSGINETGSILFFQDTDDSVDLIHNHSETCLQTKECVGDSIEFVDLDMSVISINSQDALEFRDAENIPPEVFCNNAHDGTEITRAKTISSQCTGETVYLSPVVSEQSANSLITEDLSDENVNEIPNPRHANKWYLFSEDETTNTNNAPSYGANLNQIFPVTCAVPDLSTITEMSKENDSRKPTLETDGDTVNDFEFHSVFSTHFSNSRRS